MKHLFLILFLPFTAFALPVDSIQFYKTNADFSHHNITDILEDRHGFMWIATRYGLNRFDGEEVVTWYGENSPEGKLSNSFINSLASDDEGNIWIGTYGGGVNMYDDKSGQIQREVINKEITEALANKLVTGIIKDKKGNIWISARNSGVYKVDPARGTINQYLHYADDNSSLSGNKVLAIAEDGHENIWAGTEGQGLNLFLRQNQRFIHYSVETHSMIPHNVVRVISPSAHGHVWIGFQEGLRKVSYNNGRYNIEKLPVHNPELLDLLERSTILSVLEDSKSRLWVGSENQGLLLIDLRTGKFKQYQRDPFSAHSLGSNSIWSIYEDSFGTIWTGTYNHGLYKVDPYEKSFQHIYQTQNSLNSLNHNLVTSFTEDDAGNLYIGTDGGGLNVLQSDGSYRCFTPENSALQALSVLCVQHDRQGNLWVGSWEGGLSRLKKGSSEFENFSSSGNGKGSSGKFIFDLYEDSKNRIWIASFRSGLDVYIPEKDTFYHFSMDSPKHTITSNNVYTITEDVEGNMWIGTEGSGLDKLVLNDKLETVSLTNYNISAGEEHRISHNLVSCLFTDNSKRLWAGTQGGGINRLDPKTGRFVAITKKDGLPSNLILSIEEDHTGKLWISTNKGLASYNPLNGLTEKFDEADGLQAPEFFQRASYKLRDGELLFGGINGFNRFYPEKIKPAPLYGKLFITGFNVSGSPDSTHIKGLAGKNLLHSPDIELEADQNDFSISFSYLNYTQAAKNNYQYKLEGYDQGWQNTGTRNIAFYTNVPPGNYTFKVRAANSDLQWSEEEAGLGISVNRPWYAGYPAWGVYFMLICGLLIWRKNSIVKREQLKSHLQLEHLELKKLKEVDEMKSRFFANISHEFRTPLTLILSPLKSLYYDERLQEERPRIKSMIHQADRLLDLINQILQLSKLESGSVKPEFRKTDLPAFLKPLVFSFTSLAEKQYIKYNVSLPAERAEAYIDPDKLEKIVTNLLSNAFKFTPQFGEVSFQMKLVKNEVLIIIADNGEGIPDEELSHIFTRFYQGTKASPRNSLGTGIGLALTKELVELHHGRIEVESSKSKGTRFMVYIPLKGGGFEPKNTEQPVKAVTAVSVELPEFLKNAAQELPVTAKKTEKKETILIAEDNGEIRAFLKEFLDQEFNILEAADGDQAFDLALEQKPDLVITDVVMGKTNGFELCQKLKANEKTSHLPAIILTAKASAESMEQGYSLGADYYITKPFDPNHLRLQIKNILKARNSFKARILSGNNHKITPKQAEAVDAGEAFMKQVMSIIEAHISEVDFNINDLCREIGISRMQLYRKLKASISMSANELIRHVRLQRAAQLIKQEHLSIAEITYMVGFTDLQYFRTCFKKQFGVNPSDYQQQMQAKKEEKSAS